MSLKVVEVGGLTVGGLGCLEPGALGAPKSAAAGLDRSQVTGADECVGLGAANGHDGLHALQRHEEGRGDHRLSGGPDYSGTSLSWASIRSNRSVMLRRCSTMSWFEPSIAVAVSRRALVTVRTTQTVRTTKIASGSAAARMITNTIAVSVTKIPFPVLD